MIRGARTGAPSACPALKGGFLSRSGWQIDVTGILWHRDEHTPLVQLGSSYVTDAIDRHRGPVTANLAALAFCDARGLAALVRMAGYAEQKGCPFRLASPSRSLVKIMRITGLDRRFLASQASALGPSAA
jgi:anti-anti-sigma factor